MIEPEECGIEIFGWFWQGLDSSGYALTGRGWRNRHGRDVIWSGWANLRVGRDLILWDGDRY